MDNNDEQIEKFNILGLMSGTSFDGVDAAVVTLTNGAITYRGQSHFEAYTDEERKILRGALGKWEASEEVLGVIHNAHNRAIGAIQQGFDYAAFHGQTLNHDPANGRTFQAGSPDALNVECPVVYDFRSDDVAKGGEGAPLIPIYHYTIAQERHFKKPIAFVNIGGVSNVSFVNPSLPPEEGLVAFDCGIGNALADDLVFEVTGESYDHDGQISSTGAVNQDILDQMMAHEYFGKPVPKSLDRDEFQKFRALIEHLELPDALATLNAFTVAGIKASADHFPSAVSHWIICGGGRNNSEIMRGLNDSDLNAVPIENFDLNGDMTEAEGFAYLAYRVLKKQPISYPMTTCVEKPNIGGKIYKPA